MKYVKAYEVINENKRNAKRFKNRGGLLRNDQFSGNISLSKTIADELGFDPKKEFTEGVGFDNISMYDTASGKTIVDDALSGNHTYDDLVKLAKEWYKKNESSDVNEGFKPGDMWSKDFDYEGMLKFASKVNVNTPIKTLNALFDSATDVNYHTPFRNLGIAIDWIEDGDKKGAKDYIKMFKDDIKKEMKSQGIK